MTGGRCLSTKSANSIFSRLLTICRGNRLLAAQVLGIGRTSLCRYFKDDGHSQALIARAKSASAG